jgi:tRNA (guanine37-N1)-methyltransferase
MLMRFDIITIFPGFFSGPLDYGIIRRARESRLVEAHVHDLRDFTHDKHRTVDDRPFGGGEGMVLKPEPLFEAVESFMEASSAANPSRRRTSIVLLSASGRLFRQDIARDLANKERIIFLCGRYEGVDERVADHLATDEISVGDFVLSGGELAAAIVMDAVVRLIPGALGNEDSTVNESFSTSATPADVADFNVRRGSAFAVDEPQVPNRCLLDYPHYTRPPSFRGWDVPEVLLSGNHEEIRRWRLDKALEKTRRNRPDLLVHLNSGRTKIRF